MTDTNKDLMEQLTDLQAQYEAKAKKLGKPAFVELSQSCFDACADLGAIVWTQYAPSFNDGDACVFSVHEATFHSNEVLAEVQADDGSADDLDTYEGDLDKYGSRKDVVTAKARKAFDKFDNFIQSTLGEDLCERIFGDCAKVVILRDGTVTNEYVDHD